MAFHASGLCSAELVLQRMAGQQTNGMQPTPLLLFMRLWLWRLGLPPKQSLAGGIQHLKGMLDVARRQLCCKSSAQTAYNALAAEYAEGSSHPTSSIGLSLKLPPGLQCASKDATTGFSARQKLLPELRPTLPCCARTLAGWAKGRRGASALYTGVTRANRLAELLQAILLGVQVQELATDQSAMQPRHLHNIRTC